MKIIGVVALAAASIVLGGCDATDMVDSKVLAGIQEYFPNAEVTHAYSQATRVRILTVNTHVEGVTEKFAVKTVQGLLQEYRDQIEMGFGFVGYTHLALWFGDTACGWHVGDNKFGCAKKGQNVSREYLIRPAVPLNPFVR